MDRATEMARDLADRALAREIMLSIVSETAKLPREQREDRANLLLHKRTLDEMCKFSDRLKAALQSTMEAAMEGIKKCEATK
jgi:hypothetical protein